MRIKRLILTVIAVIAALACTNLVACGGADNTYVQNLNYAESTATINNPDQGFYHPISVAVTEEGVTYNKNIVNASTQLYHLRIDISAFSAAVNSVVDKPLSQAAIDGLRSLLQYIKASDKNAIVRFAYDPAYNGSKDMEPSLQMILRHIEQICPIFDGYENTVTAIEVGLIGPWGEMHSSAIANSTNISQIIKAFLENTKDIPLLVRTPKMIYDYLGITVNDIENYSIASDKAEFRLGLFNDGYLGSDTDLGTYTNREREVEFLSTQTSHLPYGGEVVTPSSSLHNIDSCLPEMNKLCLSYLNAEWNDQVITKWKNSYYTEACGTDKNYYGSTAFSYIQNHLGYRFVLTRSTFEYSGNVDDLKIAIKLKNVGFGNLNKTKHAKLIFVNEDGTIALTETVNDFIGGGTFDCSVELNLERGKYDVYLRLYGEEMNDVPLYCLQFANDGLWNASLKANKIGRIEVKN